ncbi:MAG: Re/Si-specific NAD(P)(+) transhydrogenase subunit alpha [Thermodesulfobacteriota bacterium]
MRVGIIKESLDGERRIAAVPETVSKMTKAGTEVVVESGAGAASFISDAEFEQAGAAVSQSKDEILSSSDVILKVNKPTLAEIEKMKEGAIVVSFLQPFSSPEEIKKLAGRKVSALSMEMVPRITRAQRMDALSTMSTVAGYKVVLLAANACGRFFPMLSTAAGTIHPGKVMIIGAGVAGLQAIATAKRLGAVVTAFDVRPAAGEQVKSLGAEFVSLDVPHEQAEDVGGYAKELSPEFYKSEQELIRKYSKDSDVIISTALIPGKRAPILITEEMVSEMKPGSVIVDMAVEHGGNCTLSEAGKEVVKHGVTIIGFPNIPAMMPVHASLLYARNILAFLNLISPDGKSAVLDLGDDIIKGSLITHGGEIVHPAIKEAVK